MALRRDIPYIFISLGSFQEFDHGKSIEQTLPNEFALQVEDIFEWECGQFYGVAKVVNKVGDVCTIKKIS